MDKSQGKYIKYQLHHLPSQTKPDLAARPSAFVPSLRSWKPGRCNQPGNLWQPMDWFVGENLQESPIFNGEIYGFRLRFSPTNQSIEWLVHLQVHWCTNGHHGAPWCPTPQPRSAIALAPESFCKASTWTQDTDTQPDQPWAVAPQQNHHQMCNQ